MVRRQDRGAEANFFRLTGVAIPYTWGLDLNRTESALDLALRQVTVSNDALSSEFIP
jgi:hypothetical protein